MRRRGPVDRSRRPLGTDLCVLPAGRPEFFDAIGADDIPVLVAQTIAAHVVFGACIGLVAGLVARRRPIQVAYMRNVPSTGRQLAAMLAAILVVAGACSSDRGPALGMSFTNDTDVAVLITSIDSNRVVRVEPIVHSLEPGLWAVVTIGSS